MTGALLFLLSETERKALRELIAEGMQAGTPAICDYLATLERLQVRLEQAE